MIRDAVHLNNEIRMSLKNLCELMKLDPAPVKGEDIQKMVQGSKYRFDFATTPGVVKEVIDKIMTEYRQGILKNGICRIRQKASGKTPENTGDRMPDWRRQPESDPCDRR